MIIMYYIVSDIDNYQPFNMKLGTFHFTMQSIG